jgi:hypothetical protein
MRSLYLCPAVIGWPSYTLRHRVRFSSSAMTRRAKVEVHQSPQHEEKLESASSKMIEQHTRSLSVKLEYLDVTVLRRGVGEVRAVVGRAPACWQVWRGMQYRRSQAFITKLETSARTESKRMANHNTRHFSRIDLTNHCAAFPGLSLLNTRAVQRNTARCLPIHPSWISVASRSQWPLGLRHELSSPAATLGSWVRIPLRHGCLCVCSVCVCVKLLIYKKKLNT